MRLSVVAIALSATALAWNAWIVLEPRYWFENAYREPVAEIGPQGERGPTGPRGPRGEPGKRGLAFIPPPPPPVPLGDIREDIAFTETRLNSLFEAHNKVCAMVSSMRYATSATTNSSVVWMLDNLNRACYD